MRLIDAEHLKKRATDWDCDDSDCWDTYGQSTEDFLEYIDNEPTVDAAPVRHGHWEAVEYGDGTVRTECSVCGYGRGLPPIRNYCPNCGAKMDGKNR